ncbi:LysR substrate-binding domain-containing protein [Prauserella halophila]|uniref:LysR substrate-binding domain-containing protein n=2 Tax=Prauserella halophila TaxID=185641 RepID=A0ABP4H640_9PSEU|nr:DNA-binding transcriptional regulator, LysR family [Prauserella halophila]
MAYDLSQAGSDARRLAYFLAVVDAGTLTRAAQQLHIAQPSLSLAIRDLEQDFGAPLFNRIGRKLVLNETGQALVAIARQIVGGLSGAREAVAARTSLDTGEVTVAAPPSLAMEPLAPAIADFRRRYPGVRITIRSNPPGTEGELVAEGQVDLGLAIGGSDGERDDGLLQQPVGVHEVVAVLPPGSVPSASNALTSAELVKWPLVVTEPGSRLRARVDQMINDGLRVRIAAEVAYREAMIPLVLAGVGASILPWSVGRLAGQLGAVVVGLEPPMLSPMMLLHRQEPSAAAAVFADTLTGMYQDIRSR